MRPADRVRRAGRPLTLLLALVIPGTATAAVERPGTPQVLSTRLATLAQPAQRGASRKAQAEAVDLPASGPGSLQRLGGRLVVQVRLTPNATRAVATSKPRAAGCSRCTRITECSTSPPRALTCRS